MNHPITVTGKVIEQNNKSAVAREPFITYVIENKDFLTVWLTMAFLIHDH